MKFNNATNLNRNPEYVGRKRTGRSPTIALWLR